MSGIINATRLWYFVMCDEMINFSNRRRHFISKAHINKKAYGNVVKDYKACRNKYFHSFEYRCVYDRY